MVTRHKRTALRVAAALLLAAGLSGCVYAPPYGAYGAYDPYYPTYGYPAYSYPTYVGPPVTLDLGFGYYSHHHHGGGHYGRYRGHGWGHGGHRH